MTETQTASIAFDTWALGEYARNHGIHVYARQLLGYFRDHANEHAVEVTPFVSSSAANDANAFGPARGFRPRQTELLRFSRVWRFGGACMLASRGKCDLVFSPHCTSLYAGKSTRAVVTIHDLIPVLMPWKSQRVTGILRFCLWWSAKFSHAVITDSLSSKNDLVRVYGLPESKISVVYLGYDRNRFNTSPLNSELHRQLAARLGITKPYIFHHGVIKPNKNLRRLVQAYRLLLSDNHTLDLDLVLAGPLGWEHEEVVEEVRRTPQGSVILTGALADAELTLLLKAASLVVIPSLYEGFCLPMLEAMACGIPTIAANTSCLPEISGNVLRYFNPESVEEMAAVMSQALADETLRKELSEKGCARANTFDWDRCASETIALLARLARDGKN